MTGVQTCALPIFAPLQDDPSASRVLPDGVVALERLMAAGARLALVSGRGLSTLAQLAQVPVGTVLIGSHGAERARRKALEGMQADQLWLAGSASKELSGSFKDLVESVKGLRKGAFAPFFEQPMVRAILVPLGGAGGIQLVEFGGGALDQRIMALFG